MQVTPVNPVRVFTLNSIVIILVTMFVAIPGARAADTAEPSGVTVSSTYRLSPYDVIDMSVYNEEDLHTRARLGSDGSAILPLIGTLKLSGMTVSEANAVIQKKYSDGFVKDPHILLTVVEYRKTTFSIMGMVARPGIYEIPEGTEMSIVDAILLAGGFSHSADQNAVRVKRNVKGKPTVVKVKAGRMADTADVAPFYIRSGDVIKVPETIW